jgi:hypothetical protein
VLGLAEKMEGEMIARGWARRLLAHAFWLPLWFGCTATPTTSLQYDPISVTVASSTEKTLAVLPLEEGRGPMLHPELQLQLFKTYIPFLPYVRIQYERLDEVYLRHRKSLRHAHSAGEPFTTLFAREIARDLRFAGLFSRVDLVSDDKDAEPHDFVLRGVLRSTGFDIYSSSYMLGMAGVALWFLPMPIGKDVATVSIDLTLEDGAGRTVWRDSFSEHGGKFFTLYNSGGRSPSTSFRIEIKTYGSNDFGIDGNSLWAYHAEALRRGMAGAKASMASALRP